MMKRKAMRLKKNKAKGGVSKATRYDDGRENDAIGKALRRFESGGAAWGDISLLHKGNITGGNNNSGGNNNNDGGKNDGGKDDGKGFKGPKRVWDTDGDGVLSKKELKNRKKYLKEADTDGDGKFSKDERTAARKDYKADLKVEKEKKKEKKARKKENNRAMGVNDFKQQRAARMDRIADQYNKKVKELIAKGYPERDALVKAAYDKAEDVDPVGKEMLNKAKDTATSVSDQYEKAKDYDKTKFKDLERKANRASKYDKVGFDDVEDMAAQANYDKTEFDDLEDDAAELSDYETGEFSSEDYTTDDIQKRMSPYEELVAERARQRLKRDYEEGRGQREAEAVRAGAFGGSAAAVKEMADRKNYREALDDLNAESLQKAYESGAQLTNLADDSRYRADAATEQSRQFGSDMGMKGWEAQLAARNATAGEEGKQAQQQLAQATLTGNLRQQAAAEEANQTQYALAGVDQMQKAREAAANETARAKEAELAGIQGQGQSAQLMGQLSDQELRQYMGKADMQNKYGQDRMDYQLNRQEYPLSLMERNMNVNSAALGGSQVQTAQRGSSDPSTFEKIVGYTAAAVPAISAFSNAAGAIGNIFSNVGASGGVATPQGFQRPSLIVNLANGGIVDLHNAMFRRK